MEDYCFASWYITERCNFNCTYCSIINPKKIRKAMRGAKRILKRSSNAKYNLYTELDGVLERFKETGKKFTFGITGGEPLIYPNIIEILARIVACDDFKIALDTNLSIRKIDRFIDAVPPEKVDYIFAGLHIADRERIFGNIDTFLDNIVLLMNNGYNVDVNYVMYPPLFERIDRDYKHCLEHGVTISLKKFKGEFRGKVYPESYTEEEKNILLKYSPTYNNEEFWSRNFFGRKCNAGKNLIRIKSNGDVTRCAGDNTLLGNIFTGFKLYETAKPCVLKTCPCYSPDRLFDDPEAVVDLPAGVVLASRVKQIRNKLKGWWDQD